MNRLRLFLIVKNSYKKILPIFFALFYLVSISAGTVYAAQDVCDEAYLRDIGATTISCYDDSECSDGSNLGSVSGDDNIAAIFNYFLPKGYKDFQIAGMLGNMKAESGIQPQVLQGKAGKITKAEDVSLSTRLGYGLVQWTPARKMIVPVKDQGKDPNSLGAQLDFLWDQLEGRTASAEKKAGDALKASTDLATATLAFETKYERHAGPPQPSRITDAENILNEARAKGTTNTSNASSPTGSDNTSSSANKNISNVYILGDSITVGAKPKYTEVFGAKGIIPEISAVTGRSWISGGLPNLGVIGTSGPAKTAVQTDKDKIKNAGAIVVALGTNGGLGANPVDEIILTLKSINSTAPVYWVNIASSAPSVSPNVVPFNNKLVEQQTAGTISVINWANEVDPGGDGTHNPASILGDGIHPTSDGYNKLSALVERAVSTNISSLNQAGCDNETSGNNNSGLAGKVLEYAWPDYHRRPYTELKPAYAQAVAAAQSEGKYVGGNRHPGVDCGGFVTILMNNSGFEPEYNYGGKGGSTSIQKRWLDENWQSLGAITSTADLRPGDVAMQPGHTFVFVGSITGFNSELASASLDQRAPMADKYGMSGNGVVWYRKK